MSHDSLPFSDRHHQYGVITARLLVGLLIVAIGLVFLGTLIGSDTRTESVPEGNWVAAWIGGQIKHQPPLEALTNQTVRQSIQLSAGGDQIRIRLSNEFGTTPLAVGAASVGIVGEDGSVQPGSIRPITFGGMPSIKIPPGAPALSDPTDLSVAPFSEVAVSLFLPEETFPETYHRSRSNPVVSPEGDFTGDAAMPEISSIPGTFLARVDVFADEPTNVVVVVGDTLSEGSGHWPDYLAERLALESGGIRTVVANGAVRATALQHGYPTGGMGALADFDRNVLTVPGATHVVVFHGANDIGQPGGGVVPGPGPDVDDLIAAFTQLITRAHAHGLKVIGATILPMSDIIFNGFYSPEKEPTREGINEWIRTSGAFDAVVDFDAVVRDPTNSERYKPEYRTDNGFYLTEAGERAIAESIDLSIFK